MRPGDSVCIQYSTSRVSFNLPRKIKGDFAHTVVSRRLLDNLEGMVQIQMLFHKLKLDNPVLLTYAEDGYKDQVDYQLPQGCFHMSFRIGVGILCLSCSPKTYQSTRKHILNDRAHPGK